MSRIERLKARRPGRAEKRAIGWLSEYGLNPVVIESALNDQHRRATWPANIHH